MADIRQFVKKDDRTTLLEQVSKKEVAKEGTENQKKHGGGYHLADA